MDYGEASILDEQSDTVRIMSIHKSKGLEFPIVFTAGLGKRFNTQDTRGSILLHPELGVGMDAVDLARRTRTSTFLKKIIQEEAALENRAEELRVLYVAMTRAKEKLILTGAAEIPETLRMEPEDTGAAEERERKAERRGENAPSSDGAEEISLYQLEGAKTCLDWILPAVLPEAGQASCPIDVRVVSGQETMLSRAVERRAEATALDVLRHWDRTKVYIPALRKQLEEQLGYRYPYADEEVMKLKFTVSELKKRASLSEEAGEEMYEEPETVPLIPQFLQEDEILTGAPRGSAYHKLLELLEFSVSYDEETLREAVERFRENGKLTGEMADCIRPGDILSFLNCGSGRRMADAAARGKLYREQPFVLGVDASEIYPEDRSGEKILVQGIIDVFFEEADGLVVLDYKTDQVKALEELTEKYHAQLEYYAKALEQLTGKKVKEKIIYSFTLREEINLPG